jgi:hypothetical protein
MRFSGSANARAAIVAAVAIVAVTVCVNSRTIADPDLWGHVRFGQDIVSRGSIASADPYSYLTENEPWINHEWLAEVALASLFNAFGPAGLLLLKTVVMLAMAGLLYRHLHRLGGNTLAAGALVLAVTYIMLVGERTIRPQLFTYLFFLLWLLVLYAAETRSPRFLWLAPPIAAVWANFHGGFLAGLALLLAWAAARAGRSPLPAIFPRCPRLEKPSGWRTIAACCTLSLLATLLNPYGLGLIRFLLRTATVARPDIEEWGPIDLTKTEGLTYLALLAICLFALATTRRRRSFSLTAIFLCTALLPLVAFRHLPLFALAAGVLVGEHICDAWKRWIARSREPLQAPEALSPGRFAIAMLALSGGLLFCGANLTESLRIRIDADRCPFPARAVQLLQDSKVQGNLAILFDWGEYAIWHLAPSIKVSYDGRRETVYSDRLCDLNNHWIFGLADWDALFDRHPTDLALVDKRFAGCKLLRAKAGWTLVYEDSLCALFARSESQSLIRAIQATAVSALPADGAGLCFP